MYQSLEAEDFKCELNHFYSFLARSYYLNDAMYYCAMLCINVYFKGQQLSFCLNLRNFKRRIWDKTETKMKNEVCRVMKERPLSNTIFLFCTRFLKMLRKQLTVVWNLTLRIFHVCLFCKPKGSEYAVFNFALLQVHGRLEISS